MAAPVPTMQRLDKQHGIVTQAWSPIGGITSYRGMEKRSFDDPTLLEIARQHGKSAAQVMLPRITVQGHRYSEGSQGLIDR